ncbi:MAG: hypothetical protein ABEK04_02270 [Candidatus Nanohalobium sp.]
MEGLDLGDYVDEELGSYSRESEADAGFSTGLSNQDRGGFEWVDESTGQGQFGIGGLSSFDEALTSLESWRDWGRKLEPETNQGRENLREFDRAATHVLEDPETYATTYFHGTANDVELNTPLDDIISDGELKASRETGNSETGEYGDLPKVSVSAAPMISRFYAETSTPTLEDVYESVENDILGRRLEEEEKSKDWLENTIGRHLHEADPEDWRYRGHTLEKHLEEGNWSEDDVREYAQQRRHRYGSLLSRFDSLKSEERLEPVMFGFDSEAIQGEVSQVYPLHKNELIENNLSEVRAEKVDLEDATVFVPMENLQEYEKRYGDQINVGTIEGLTALHMAQNKDIYMEQHHDLSRDTSSYEDILKGEKDGYQSPDVEKKHKKFQGMSVWAGHTMGIHYGPEEDEFDLNDPTRNPYALDLLNTR